MGRLSVAMVSGWLSACCMLATTLIATSASAEESPSIVSFGLVARRGTLSPTFGSSTFSGNGYDVSGQRHYLSEQGLDLGISRPSVHVYDVGVDLDIDAFHGGLFFGLGKTGADLPHNPRDTPGFYPVDLTYFRMGLELGSSLWIGEHLRLTIASMLGFQSLSVPLPGLTNKCKNGTCAANASAFTPWIAPRLGFEVLLGEKLGLGVGGYVGTDIFHPQDVETGITLSFRGLGEEAPSPPRT